LARAKSLELGLVFFFACSACAADPAESIVSTSEAVIYGRDDRIEAYATADGPLKDAALRASALIVAREAVRSIGGGRIALESKSLIDTYGVCAQEPFADQPSAGFCSGVLVADDVVLTAGHCLALWSCPRLAFVFGHHYTAPGTLSALEQGDVYHCAEVLKARVSEHDASERLDYGFIRLDRRVGTELQPVVLNPTDALVAGDSVALVGHGAGLPTKIAADGRVIDERAGVRDYFYADVDDFEGGSGSGVFDAQGALVGVAARGEADFEAAEEGCLRSRAGGSAGGEQVTYLARAIEGLCEDPAAPAPCPGHDTRASGGCATVRAGTAGAAGTASACLAALAWFVARRRRPAAAGAIPAPTSAVRKSSRVDQCGADSERDSQPTVEAADHAHSRSERMRAGYGLFGWRPRKSRARRRRHARQRARALRSVGWRSLAGARDHFGANSPYQ
jgi:V8-like Glu-specific endopeptidase